MSSRSAASALPVTDAPGSGPRRDGDPRAPDAQSQGSRSSTAATQWTPGGVLAFLSQHRTRVLTGAAVVSLLLHVLAITGAADWLAEHFRWNEPEAGPPLRAVLLPPPPPVYQAPVKAVPPKPKPKPTPKPKVEAPPAFAASPPAPAIEAVEPAIVTSEPPASTTPPVAEAPVVPEPAAPAAPEAIAEVTPTPPAVDDRPPPTVKVPKRIDLVGTLFVGDTNFMVGNGGFRLRHDGNRYEISVLGTPKGLARLLFSGEFNGVSRGAITPTGLQPSEYTEERGGREKRETATLDWEAGVVRLKDDKVAPIEPPMFDRLSVILQFYYRPPDASEMTMRVAGTRGVDTYMFRRLRNETLELPGRSVDAQLWRVNHDNGEPRIDLWMSPDYHYLPLRVRVYARKEFGGRHATLNIDEIRVED